LLNDNECDLALSKCPAWGRRTFVDGSRAPAAARDGSVGASLL